MLIRCRYVYVILMRSIYKYLNGQTVLAIAAVAIAYCRQRKLQKKYNQSS